MDAKARKKISKFASLVLRHRPEVAGLRLDAEGWVDVDDFLRGCAKAGHPLTRAQLEEAVATNDKKRFAFSEDGAKIRASQGHSVEVELGYRPAPPPDRLFHGTVDAALPAIRREGLRKMKRHHVHLSFDRPTAERVATRRGPPRILEVRAAQMHADGHAFFVSDNGVWLTETVPVAYVDFPDDTLP